MTRDLSEIPEPANWLNPNNKDIAFNEVKAFLNTAKTQEKFQEKMDSYELNFQGFMDTISDQEKEFIYNKINQYLQKINENNGFTAFLEQLAGWCHEC